MRVLTPTLWFSGFDRGNGLGLRYKDRRYIVLQGRKIEFELLASDENVSIHSRDSRQLILI